MAKAKIKEELKTIEDSLTETVEPIVEEATSEETKVEEQVEEEIKPIKKAVEKTGVLHEVILFLEHLLHLQKEGGWHGPVAGLIKDKLKELKK